MKLGNHIVYVVVNQNRELVGLDEPSGGYPYVPSFWNNVKFWKYREDADSYCDTMNTGSYGKFRSVELRIHSED